MGEAIWCNVTFRVPAGWSEWAEPLADQFMESYADATDDVLQIQLSGEGNYGLLDSDIEDLLSLLVEYRVPFIASDETKYDMPGLVIVFDGLTSIDGTSGRESGLLTLHEYESIIAGTHWAHTVDDYFRRLNISIDELSIEHLGPWPPPDDAIAGPLNPQIGAT